MTIYKYSGEKEQFHFPKSRTERAFGKGKRAEWIEALGEEKNREFRVFIGKFSSTLAELNDLISPLVPYRSSLRTATFFLPENMGLIKIIQYILSPRSFT